MEGGDSEAGCSLTGMWALLTEVFQIWLRIKEEILLIIVSLGHTAHDNSCWKAPGRGLGLALIADAYSAKQLLPNHSSAPSSAGRCCVIWLVGGHKAALLGFWMLQTGNSQG